MKKVFEIDFDSVEEILRVNNILKSRMGELRKNQFGSKKQRTRDVFLSCQNVWNTDIDFLYNDLNLDNNPIYYVYAHCDPIAKIAIGKDGRSTFSATLGMTHLPFYIGKGVGERAYDLKRNETHRKVRQNLAAFNKEPIITIVKDELTECQALSYESKLIDIFGVIGKGGRLTNLDEGINSLDRRKIYKEDLRSINLLYRELL